MAASSTGLHSSSAHDCKGPGHGASLFVVNTDSTSRSVKAAALPAILTVIALVVLVGSLAAGARRFADEKAVLNAGIVSHARVIGVLERYKTEFQDYPAPARPEETVVIDGRTFPVGAAMMFYQILSGDGTDQISVSSTTGKPSDGTIDNDEPSTLALGLEWFPWKHVDGRWFAVDVHGHPFQYQNDLWSYNGDASAIGLHDAATKRDPVKTARWIKNFPIKPAVPEPTK
jgi:hypothetical protein